MDHGKHFNGLTQGIHHAFSHVVITLLAVGIAFPCRRWRRTFCFIGGRW